MFRTNLRNLSAAGLLVLVLLYQFVCAPGIRKIRDLNRIYTQKQKDLETLNNLILQYKSRTNQTSIVFAPENFNLYLFVSKTLEVTGLKSQVSRITPISENILLNAKEQRITVTLEDVELAKLLGFLNEVEKRGFLRFGYLQISRNPQKQFFVKTEMEIFSYKKNGQ